MLLLLQDPREASLAGGICCAVNRHRLRHYASRLNSQATCLAYLGLQSLLLTGDRPLRSWH